MVAINYANREVSCKIVYYGPGLSGKTTNLQYIHGKVPNTTRGDLISLATDADRTLYFDFLPINIGAINGFTTRFQLYTVPGQVFYNATRKLVLRGVDGLIFVADSQRDKADENVESFNNLKENLAEYGYDLADIPLILQYNKRDISDIMTVEELNNLLNENNWPVFESVAHKGKGVFDTLKLIIKMILEKARKSGTAKKIEEGSSTQQTPAPAVAPDAAPAVKPVQASEPQTDKIPIPGRMPEQPSPGPADQEMRPAAQVPETGRAEASPHMQDKMSADRPESRSPENRAVSPEHSPDGQNHSSTAAVAEPGKNTASDDNAMTSFQTNQDVEDQPDEGFEENTMADENGSDTAEAEEEVVQEDVRDDKSYSTPKDYIIEDQKMEEPEPAIKEEERVIQNEEESEKPEEEELEDPFALPGTRPKMAAPMRARPRPRIMQKKKKGFFLFRMFGKK
jgi:signal recognition particle receptor subunit beta